MVTPGLSHWHVETMKSRCPGEIPGYGLSFGLSLDKPHSDPMNASSRRLRLGIPKGSLQDTTQKLFIRAGYDLRISGRSYYPDIDDAEIQCILIRPRKWPATWATASWTAPSPAWTGSWKPAPTWPNWPTCAPPGPTMARCAGSWRPRKTLPFHNVADLQGKRIATEAVGMTKHFLEKHGVAAEVEFSWGATEVKPPILADAIVDVSETGSSLRANGLKVMHVVLESTPRFIANHDALKAPWKRDKIERVLMLLKSAIAAATRVLLSMNAPRAGLEGILSILPALATPTLSTLADPEWVELSTVVDEKQVRELIPRLYTAGARGIIELPINKIVE
jgi:ATP phosphoribosyltransferase